MTMSSFTLPAAVVMRCSSQPEDVPDRVNVAVVVVWLAPDTLTPVTLLVTLAMVSDPSQPDQSTV